MSLSHLVSILDFNVVPVVLIAASWLLWTKYKNLATFMMVFGFLVAWVFGALGYYGPSLFWSNELGQETYDPDFVAKIFRLGNISAVGSHMGIFGLLLFAIQHKKDNKNDT